MDGLILTGELKEQGRIHGESYRNEIHELAAIRQHLIRSFLKKFSLWDLEKFYHQQVLALSKVPELFDEFQGIAEGARIGLHDLMVLNNYTDMRDFLRLDPDSDEGCSTFYFKNSHTQVAGQTWDMHGSATPFVRYVESEFNGVGVRLFTVTGCLALAGVNSYGVGVLINNLHSLECSVKGLMWPGLVKLILMRAKNLQEAKNILEKYKPSSGHHYLLFSNEGAASIETTGLQTSVMGELKDGNEGFLLHTNHYLTHLALYENKEKKSSTTEARLEVLKEVFERKYKDFDFEKVQKCVFSEKAAETLCIPLNPSKPHASATCGGLSWDAQTGKIRMFQGLYTDGDHKEFVINR
jgi:isopenicillin-N N-acyltransferase-like protein